MFGLVNLLDPFENDVLVNVLILIDSREDIRRVNHHPREPISALVDFSWLPIDRPCSETGRELGLFNNILLDHLQLKRLTGIRLHRHLPPKIRQTLNKLGHSQRPRQILPFGRQLIILVLLDDPFHHGRHVVVCLLQLDPEQVVSLEELVQQGFLADDEFYAVVASDVDQLVEDSVQAG